MFSVKVSRLVNAMLLSLVAGSVASAAGPQTPASDLDYGEMYVVQKHEAPPKPWEVSLSYTYGFSNPYIGIHGGNLGFRRQLGEFVIAGVSGTYFGNSNSEVHGKIESILGGQGISALVTKPQYSTYIDVGIIPLSGILNWFGTKSLNFDLVLGLGGGIAGYHSYDPVLPTIHAFITPKLMLNSTVGLTAGLITTWDRFNGDDWQNRVDTMFGVFVRF